MTTALQLTAGPVCYAHAAFDHISIRESCSSKRDDGQASGGDESRNFDEDERLT
jgi:hypothetical protein